MSYLRWGTLEKIGNGFWAWAKWLDGGRKGPRPNVSWDVPAWAWKRYELHRGKPKPPPPVQVPPPFSGVGLLTAHDPRAVLRLGLQGKVSYVALKADGGDRADLAVAGELRAAGFRVYVWEAENMLGQTAVDRYRAEAYIAQDEGPGQRVAALDRASEGIRVPKALVSNLWASDWPQGWVCLGEAYTGTNPSATPAAIEYEARKRGAAEFVPVFSLYDGRSENPSGGRRITVAEYLTMWPDRKRWAGYLAENLDPGDM